nr:amidohydrolase family protein [bacterium]
MQSDPLNARMVVPEEFQRHIDAMRQLRLEGFRPDTGLTLPEHPVDKPKFPLIDFHTHCFPLFGSMKTQDFVKELDKVGVLAAVNLVGYDGEDLDRALEEASHCDGRIAVFGGLDFSRAGDKDFPEYVRSTLSSYQARGMTGVKVYKEVGLTVKVNGELLSPVDPRVKVVWDTCAELGLPVLIHVADPQAFFRPMDEKNERIEELCTHPAWWFGRPGVPSFEEMMAIEEQLIAENPKTTFVVAHIGSLSESLGRIGAMIDKYPNLYVDIAARLAELGRQPYTARKFLIDHADRVLFGTDTLGCECIYHRYYYRCFETMDEYFHYADEFEQGHWMIYGLGLPDDVLEKLYYKNAVKLLPCFRPLVEAALKA